MQPDTVLIVSGMAKVEKLFEQLNIEADDTDAQSVIVNGWIMNELGQIPQKGDSFEYKDYRITVSEMTENRVEKALVKKQHEI